MTDETNISIREYLQLQITTLEREISRLQSSNVDKARFDQLRLQVASLSEAVQELEQRLDVLEDHDSIGMWAFRLIVGVGTALTIGWLSGFIG